MGQQKKCYYDQTEAIFKTITAQLLLDSVYSIIFTSYYDLGVSYKASTWIQCTVFTVQVITIRALSQNDN